MYRKNSTGILRCRCSGKSPANNISFKSPNPTSDRSLRRPPAPPEDGGRVQSFTPFSANSKLSRMSSGSHRTGIHELTLQSAGYLHRNLFQTPWEISSPNSSAQMARFHADQNPWERQRRIANFPLTVRVKSEAKTPVSLTAF